MIKAIFRNTEGKKDSLFIGLSRGNLNNLMKGLPIQFGLKELSHDVIIHFGETEESIEKEVEKLMGPVPKERRMDDR